MTYDLFLGARNASSGGGRRKCQRGIFQLDRDIKIMFIMRFSAVILSAVIGVQTRHGAVETGSSLRLVNEVEKMLA